MKTNKKEMTNMDGIEVEIEQISIEEPKTEFAKIYVSKNYEAFGKIAGNRRLNQTKYFQLLQSMKEEQLIIPILVNDKMEIIDGQHRFEACKELGLPVYFYVQEGYGIDQVKRANLVSSNWTKENYLELHLSDGIPEYEEFDELQKISGLKVYDLMKVYAKAQGKSIEQLSYEFENGDLTDTNVENVIGFLNALSDFRFFKYYKKKQFVAAMIKLYFDERYDHERMKSKLDGRANVLEGLTANVSKDDYLAKLSNSIYSFGPGKKNLFYDATNKRLYE